MASRLSRLRSWPFTLALGVAAFCGGFGCIPFGDPEGPGAAGTISLGAGVSTDALSTLRIRATPDKGFDLSKPVFPAAGGEGSDWISDGDGSDLKTLTFPFKYNTSTGLGTTPEKRWRLFVWLSKSPSAEDPAPASGEAFGTVTFEVDGCGQYGDYCGVKEGVDVVIDKVVP